MCFNSCVRMNVGFPYIGYSIMTSQRALLRWGTEAVQGDACYKRTDYLARRTKAGSARRAVCT